MLRQLDKTIWVAEQPLVYMGLPVETRMTVVQLSNRNLAVISPIAPTEAIKQQLDEIGAVEHIIAPNTYHHLFAGEMKAAYPNAILWATAGLKEKKPELPIDRTIQLNDNPLWNDLDTYYFDGLKTLGFNGIDDFEEWVFFHAQSRTLILTDAAFHYDDSFPLFKRLVARMLGCYRQLSPSLLEKVATKDRDIVEASLQQVLKWDFDRVVMAHGSVVEQGGQAKLTAGYERFLR